MTKLNNKNIEKKTFIGGVYMDKDHMEAMSKQVSESYQEWAKVAEYNTIHQT